MNCTYQIIEDKVIVTSDLGLKTTREISNNFEEILITENNIEEIEELIIKEKNNINVHNTTETIGPVYIGLSISNLILSIEKYVNANIIAGIIHMCASVAFFTTSYFLSILPIIKRKKIKNKKIQILNRILDEEQEKLYELKKDKTNDLMYVNQEFKILSRSTQIKMLKDRLDDINLYMNHRNEIIKLYKKGLLVNELYASCDNHDTIDFIIELVKNDLNTEIKSKNNKVKVKINDIEYGSI